MRYDGQFRLAHELKKQLHELLGWDEGLTHRQYLCWSEWLDFYKVNQPGLTEHHLMGIQCEIRRSYTKNPHSVKPEQFRLRFHKKGEKVTNESKDDRTERIRRLWVSRMTAPITRIDETGNTEIIEPPIVKRRKLLEEREQARNKTRQQRLASIKQPLSDPPPTTPTGDSNGIQQRRNRRRNGGKG